MHPLALAMSNPYESPRTQIELSTITDRNPIARVGFLISFTGVLALFASVGPFESSVSRIFACIAFVSFPGLIVSGIGLFRSPRRLAGWGVALGIFGSLYLPTFYLALTR